MPFRACVRAFLNVASQYSKHKPRYLRIPPTHHPPRPTSQAAIRLAHAEPLRPPSPTLEAVSDRPRRLRRCRRFPVTARTPVPRSRSPGRSAYSASCRPYIRNTPQPIGAAKSRPPLRDSTSAASPPLRASPHFYARKRTIARSYPTSHWNPEPTHRRKGSVRRLVCIYCAFANAQSRSGSARTGSTVWRAGTRDEELARRLPKGGRDGIRRPGMTEFEDV